MSSPEDPRELLDLQRIMPVDLDHIGIGYPGADHTTEIAVGIAVDRFTTAMGAGSFRVFQFRYDQLNFPVLPSPQEFL